MLKFPPVIRNWEFVLIVIWELSCTVNEPALIEAETAVKVEIELTVCNMLPPFTRMVLDETLLTALPANTRLPKEVVMVEVLAVNCEFPATVIRLTEDEGPLFKFKNTVRVVS